MRLNLRSSINMGLAAVTGFRLERVRPRRHTARSRGNATPAHPIEESRDLRFRIATWVYSAPVSKLVGRPLFGYGPQSWHPLVAASRELLDDIDASYDTSVLKRFYDTFAPKTIAEAYQLKDPGPLNRVPAQTLFEPWLLAEPPFDDPFAVADGPPGSPLFGPLNNAAGKTEWSRLRRCVKSIQKYGYQPGLFPRGRINVVVLRSQQQERYLVVHGQHRAAVLAAMGAERIEVGTHSILPPVVDESEAHLWPYVQSGFLSEEVAVAVLRRYFTTPESDPALKIGAAAHGLSPSMSVGR